MMEPGPATSLRWRRIIPRSSRALTAVPGVKSVTPSDNGGAAKYTVVFDKEQASPNALLAAALHKRSADRELRPRM